MSAASGSTAKARSSPPPGATATRFSSYGSGAWSNSCAIPCLASTSISSVRRPPTASARASAAATVVLPVPPLPVTTWSRARTSSSGQTGDGITLCRVRRRSWADGSTRSAGHEQGQQDEPGDDGNRPDNERRQHGEHQDNGQGD